MKTSSVFGLGVGLVFGMVMFEEFSAVVYAAEQNIDSNLAQSRVTERWQAGVHYALVDQNQAGSSVYSPGVEVIEFFWYACPHCHELEPSLNTWLVKKPPGIIFRRVPVVWGPQSKVHARLFYTLEVLGRDDLNAKVFASIYERGEPLYAEGNEKETLRKLEKFSEENGISRSEFLIAYNSDAVNSRVTAGNQLAKSLKIEGVPTIVINRKYRTTIGKAGGTEKIMSLVTYLAVENSNEKNE